jgi:DNA-binding Lrp family transcriptional regulator
MTNAIVLLKVSKDRINEVAETIVDLEGVSEVYSVAGQYDLAAVIRAKGDSQVASLVTEQILKAEGILSSETMIAFRTYSRYDLERMFSIGMD